MGSEILTALYGIGEMLTMTWPGRIVLGFAVSVLLSRFVRA